MQATDNCMFIQIISEYKTCIQIYVNGNIVYTPIDIQCTCKTCTPIIHVYRYVYHKDMRIFTCSLITMNWPLCTYIFIYNYTDNIVVYGVYSNSCVYIHM